MIDTAACSPVATPVLQRVTDRMRRVRAVLSDAGATQKEIIGRVFGEFEPPPPPALAAGGDSFEAAFNALANDLDDLATDIERRTNLLNQRL